MSFLRHKSGPIVYGLLALLLAAVCIVSILTGPAQLGWSEMWNKGIFGLRAARTLMASVAGAGLSVAGVVFQSLFATRWPNPMCLA